MIELTSSQLEKTALLYDVEKFLLRGQDSDKIAETGANFLKSYLPAEMLSCIAGTTADSKAVHSLLREADTLSSGTNSRKVNRKIGRKLENVFNIFGVEDKITTFDMRVMRNDELILPTVDDADEDLNANYAEILSELQNRLAQISVADCQPNDIAQILETVWSYVPAGSAENELSDISLYDHAKLTAAYAVCLQKYLRENNLDIYDKLETLRDEEIFLLVSGDISGIQQFIYTIPTKGALKSLRGRSFYLEILLEHIADEILAAVEVSRNCLLYTGGGHFYLLLPNTKSVVECLKNFSADINSWFLKHFGSRLYLATGWTPCKAQEFLGQTNNGTGEVFRRVSEELSRQKLCRYSATQLAEIFSPNSAVNKTLDGTRECGICHTSAKELTPYDDTLACESCRNLYKLGKKMLDGDGFAVVKKIFVNADDDTLPLPSLNDELVLYPVAKGESFFKFPIVRTYLKRRGETVNANTTGIWLADYVTRDEFGNVLEFDELASRSGGDYDSTGIKRLGVLRADVDNLGAAFMAGFPREFSTLTRSATLSRQLAYFFKHLIIFICNGANKKFRLFDRNKNNSRNVHVVYSGGDDVFMVGAWDDLIEVAVDIRRTFEQFTNGKLTFSAGIGFFKPKYPVAELARQTGILEDAAKGNPNKDSIALFGVPTLVKSDTQNLGTTQRYSWKIFAEKVFGQKLKFLLDNFNFGTTATESKLTIGKSGLYRILNFLPENDSARKSVNLARFAYVLARLNPGENKSGFAAYEKIRDKFYFWYKNEQDRRELRTAIELVIYSLRDKEAF